jgi:hypothetical protein
MGKAISLVVLAVMWMTIGWLVGYTIGTLYPPQYVPQHKAGPIVPWYGCLDPKMNHINCREV